MTDVIEKVKDVIEDVAAAAEEIVEEVQEAVSGEAESEAVLALKGVPRETSEKVSTGGKAAEDVTEILGGEGLERQEAEPLSDSFTPEQTKAAEAESVDPVKEKSLAERKKELQEKLSKIKTKVDVAPGTEELKEQVKIKKRTDMLIELEEYVKAGIYLGTRVVTPDMKPFVYRRRADGLAIFNTDLIDEKLKEGIGFLSKFNAEDVILVCKRQAGWKAAKKFSELTGIRVFTKKYPAGVLTNTDLVDFFENELTIVTDSWLDKNALNDTVNVQKKVLMVCDTNNFAKGADQVIIGNNKSGKSLGVIFYLLTRGFCKAKGIECDIPDLDWWTGEEFDSQRGAKLGV